jgi:hypothetical protein
MNERSLLAFQRLASALRGVRSPCSCRARPRVVVERRDEWLQLVNSAPLRHRESADLPTEARWPSGW